jgi:ubiquinone/menaquinone biosynthesis C-methylase UbiE
MNQPPNFSRLAGLYRWMEWASFGPWLGWCRCAFLTEVSACRNTVVFGDGDGRFTARMLATNPTVQIEAVDASSAMLAALARRARPNSARLRTSLADARAWRPISSLEIPAQERQTYDLIVTHFFLDCLTTDEVRALATKLRRVTSPSALWLVSEFAIPPTWFGRLVARPLVSALYAAFALLTGLAVRNLPDYQLALRAAGFTIRKRRTWLGGLLISELWSANPLTSP